MLALDLQPPSSSAAVRGSYSEQYPCRRIPMLQYFDLHPSSSWALRLDIARCLPWFSTCFYEFENVAVKVSRPEHVFMHSATVPGTGPRLIKRLVINIRNSYRYMYRYLCLLASSVYFLVHFQNVFRSLHNTMASVCIKDPTTVMLEMHLVFSTVHIRPCHEFPASDFHSKFYSHLTLLEID